jgi:hypothetical protein
VLEKVIAAHGQVAMELTLDLRHASQPLPRNFDTTVTLETTDPAGRRLSNIVGVRARVTASPIRLVDSGNPGGTVIRGVPESWERRFAVSVDDTAADVTAEVVGDAVQACTLAPGATPQERILHVALSPELATGPYRGFVRLSLDATEHGGRFYVPVHGAIVADAQSYPSAITWGATPVGEVLNDVISIRTRSGRPIAKIMVDDPSAGTTVAVDDSRSDLWSHAYQIETRASAPGNRSEALRFQVFIEGEPEPHALDVAMNYYGIAAPTAAVVSNGSSQ